MLILILSYILASLCVLVNMGTAKKEKARKERQGKLGDGMNNVKTKGENFYRYNPILQPFPKHGKLHH